MIQLAFLPLLKSAGGAIAGLLRSIPAKTWRTILYLALVLAALLYGNHTGKAKGLAKGLKERDKVQAAWDQAVDRGRKEIARQDRENAAAEAKAQAEAAAIGEKRNRDLQDAIKDRDSTIARLRTGELRLRKQWVGCLSAAGARQAAAVPSGPMPDADLRGGDAIDLAGAVGQSIFIAQRDDSRIARLIEFQDVLRKQCQAIGGAP